jgi:hypothetical protein
MKSQIHKLQLIFPPISNQEAEWIKTDIDAQKELSRSNLYMIGQRPEAKYIFSIDKNNIIKNGIIYFEFSCNERVSTVEIDINKILELQNDKSIDYEDLFVELGDKLIRIWAQKEPEKLLLEWFTTEKLLFDRSRNVSYINKLNDYRDHMQYILHYVGISKKEDSLSRLVIKPHDKRLRILSNEYPFNSTSRVTDEIILFFFAIDTLRITEYTPQNHDEFIEKLITKEYNDYKLIISDAEKAFVKIMNTEYNTLKYENFPISSDGLYNEGIDCYTYFIGDSVSFYTEDNNIVGEFTPFEVDFTNKAEIIIIRGENAELVKNI